MSNNVFEEHVSEYLRYNGFFLIRGFVIHFEDDQAQGVDFVGVKLPKSVEQTVYSNGGFSNFVFQDDGEKLSISDPSEIILLIAEVTESSQDREIKKRIDKLRNPIRIGYALQRLGIIEKEAVNELIKGKSINYFGDVRTHLSRVLFVLNNQIAEKYRKENKDITFISQSHTLSFIKERAKIDIKQRARTHLPPWLHYFVNELLQRYH